MGLELTTDRFPPIKSQTRYPLRHAASFTDYSKATRVRNLYTAYTGVVGTNTIVYRMHELLEILESDRKGLPVT